MANSESPESGILPIIADLQWHRMLPVPLRYSRFSLSANFSRNFRTFGATTMAQ
jgi:hypothetical protein